MNPYTEDKFMSIPRNIKMKELPEIVGLSRASIYRLMDKGEFPVAIKLTSSENGPVAWREEEIIEWRETRERAKGINRRGY